MHNRENSKFKYPPAITRHEWAGLNSKQAQSSNVLNPKEINNFLTNSNHVLFPNSEFRNPELGSIWILIFGIF